MPTYYKVAWQQTGSDEIYYGMPINCFINAKAWVDSLNEEFANRIHHWVEEYYIPFSDT